MKYIKHIALLLVSLLLYSCLSSRIGESDSDIVSAEQSFMIQNFKESSLNEWESGKEFVCVVDELPTLLEPRIGIKEDYSDFKGTRLRYKGLEESQTWTGTESFVVYEDNNGSEFIYRIKKPVAEILSSNFLPLLPELVSTEYIALADSLLKGETLYIKTSNWYSINETEIRGRRLIPVTIEEVIAGNKIFPLAIKFKTNNGEEAIVYTTMSASQYMSQYSTFDKLFTFTNPRDKYSQINDEVWQLITLSKVKEGMTKNECQISLGLPDEVSQIPEYSGLRERWIYRTGTYLEFKDGLLVKFRLM